LSADFLVEESPRVSEVDRGVREDTGLGSTAMGMKKLSASPAFESPLGAMMDEFLLLR
jgi:hypothetical protein